MNFPGPINSHLSSVSAVSLGGDHFSFVPKADSGSHGAAIVVVPDANLLFSGDYKREGSDLILSAQDQKYVVHDYFKGDKHPLLASTDGATLSGDVVSALTGHVQYAQAATSNAAANVIGQVMKMTGSASVVRNGVAITLNVGDAVQKGDVVQTGSDSSVNLTLMDGTVFGMTSNARMVLNEMVYDPNGTSNSSLISLVQGTITFVAGQTAKNGNMRVDTPVATMGIRGTAVLVEISADNGPTKFSVLLEPDGHTGRFNLYDKTTGQLIGTVSQAGQVTFVSPAGVGQQALASEQPKSPFDLQSEKGIIQDVFKLYFPNYNPDSNPKSTDHPRTDIGVPQNTITKNGVDDFGRPTVTTITTFTNPDTHTTTTVQVVYVNTPPSFSVADLGATQWVPPAPAAPPPGFTSFKLGDRVTITDPDINTAPFLDVPIPYVANSGHLVQATGPSSIVFGSYLQSPLRIQFNPVTGLVSYDAAQFRFLDDGETATYKFTFTAASGVGGSGSDSATLSLTLTLTGANDAPTIVTSATHAADGVTEDVAVQPDGKIKADGVITFQDYDLTDGHTIAPLATPDPSYIGTFTIQLQPEDVTDTNDTGTVSWHFELSDNNAKLQSLAQGETLTQAYTVTITDNNGVPVQQVVTITITGTNDTPVLDADIVGSVPVIHHASELTDSTGVTTADTATGTLSFTDVDLTDTHVASAVLDSNATTSIVWSGHSAGDLPSGLRAALANAVSASISTDSTGTGAGTVHWDFSANDDLFDFLGETETLTLTYNVTVEDYYHDGTGAHLAGTSSTQTVTVVIGAANDRPVILNTSTLEGTTAETPGLTGDGTDHTVTGTIDYSDADLSDVDAIVQDNGAAVWTDIHGVTHAITDPAIINASHLVFGTVDQTGNTAGWTYTVADNALDFLADGETLVVTYDIAVQDNSGTGNDTSTTQQIKVTITGANDAPVISVASPAAVAEGDTATPDAVTVTVADHVTIADVDTTDVQTKYDGALAFDHATGPAPQAGSLSDLFTLDTTNGTIQYDRAAFDYLGDGDHVVATFTFNSTSGADTLPQTITITIDGANDAPAVSAVLTEAATEGDAATSFDLLAGATDVDHDETATLTVVAASVLYAIDGGTATATVPGGLSLSGSTLSFDPADAAFDHLAAGQTQDIVVSYDVADVHGAIVHQTETITITGTNDAPVADAHSPATVNYVENNAPMTINSALTLSDADSANLTGATVTISSHFYSSEDVLGFTAPSGIIGNYDSASGILTFTGTASLADYQSALQSVTYFNSSDDPSGDTRTISYQVDDGQSAHHGSNVAAVTVAVTPQNDAPVISTDNLHISGGSSPTDPVTVLGLSVADPDSGDTFTITAVTDGSGSGTGASITPSSGDLADINGALTAGVVYTPGTAPPNVDKLSLTVTDNSGASDTVNFIFNQSGAGPFILNGTSEKDVFFGTGNPDTFVFAPNSGHDTIVDFTSGVDTIDLSALASFDSTAITALLAGATHPGGSDTLLHLDGAVDTILVKNVTTLAASDFIIHV